MNRRGSVAMGTLVLLFVLSALPAVAVEQGVETGDAAAPPLLPGDEPQLTPAVKPDELLPAIPTSPLEVGLRSQYEPPVLREGNAPAPAARPPVTARPVVAAPTPPSAPAPPRQQPAAAREPAVQDPPQPAPDPALSEPRPLPEEFTVAPGGSRITESTFEELPVYEYPLPSIDAPRDDARGSVIVIGDPDQAPAPDAAAADAAAVAPEPENKLAAAISDYVARAGLLLAGLFIVVVAAVGGRRWWKKRQAQKQHLTLADIDKIFDQQLREQPGPAAAPDLAPPVADHRPEPTVVAVQPDINADAMQEIAMQRPESPSLLDYEELKYREVYRLFDSGMKADEISRRTGYGEGEIGLVLDIYQLQNA